MRAAPAEHTVSLRSRSLSPLAELFIDGMRALAKPAAKAR
jgi:hypothetical protein